MLGYSSLVLRPIYIGRLARIELGVELCWCYTGLLQYARRFEYIIAKGSSLMKRMLLMKCEGIVNLCFTADGKPA